MAQHFSLGDGEALKNPNQKRQINREMFAIIAPKYDWITQILSFGQDRHWKQNLINSLPSSTAPLCLDLACGTGDISRQLGARYPQGQVLGIDLCAEMLHLAQKQPQPLNCRYLLADMLSLPVADNSIDIVTGGAQFQAELLKFWTRMWGFIFHRNPDVYILEGLPEW